MPLQQLKLAVVLENVDGKNMLAKWFLQTQKNREGPPLFFSVSLVVSDMNK